MYIKVPLNGIRNALGQEAVHACFFIVLLAFSLYYNQLTWLNGSLLLMHVFAYVAIYV